MGKVIPERFHTTSLVSLLAENLNLGIKLARIISGGVLVVLKRSDSQFVVKGQLTHFKLRKFETAVEGYRHFKNQNMRSRKTIYSHA